MQLSRQFTISDLRSLKDRGVKERETHCLLSEKLMSQQGNRLGKQK